jgi:hypothetical protein
MLLWIPQQAPAYGDNDEKSTKVKRQAQVKAVRTAIACVASIFIVMLVTMLQLRVYDGSSQDPKLRQRRQKNLLADSIYRLSVKDSLGKLTSLERFAGQVTLVVNTACL